MLTELPGIEQLPIRIPCRLVDERVLDCGDALPVQRLERGQYAVAPLLGRRRGDQVRDELLRRLLQHTARTARSVAIDRAAWRSACRPADFCESQRVAVGCAIVSGRVLEPHGIVRCHRIQIARKDVATLGKLAFVPAFTLEPFPRLELADSHAHALHDLCNVGRIAQLNVVELTQPAIGYMGMRVDETRGGRAPVQVDHARVRTLQREDCGVTAHREDAAVANRNGLRNRVAAVDRDHRAVHQNEIGRYGVAGRGSRDQRHPHGGDRREPPPVLVHGPPAGGLVCASGLCHGTGALMKSLFCCSFAGGAPPVAGSLRSRSGPHQRGIEHLDERRTIVGVRLPFIELNELLDLGLDRVLGLLRVGHHHVPQLRFGLG